MKIKLEIETGWAQTSSTLELTDGMPRSEAIAWLKSLLDACSIHDETEDEVDTISPLTPAQV